MTRQPVIIILGAGILGSALAWRLAAQGVCKGKEILVVDPNPLASQASSRAAALLSLSRPTNKEHWIPLVRRTLAAVDELAALGHEVPIRRCGALHLADGAPTRAILADHLAAATAHELPFKLARPTEFADCLPWLDLTRFTEALWFPDEAYTDPYLLASAYVAAARALGVVFRPAVPVRLGGARGHVTVHVDGEKFSPESIWVAAGAWSTKLLLPLGTAAPQAAVRSQYWITDPTHFAQADMPMVLAGDLRLYARPEVGAILFGLRESDGVAANSSTLSDDLDGFTFDQHDPEGIMTLEQFAPLLTRYAPRLMEVGLRHYVSGPSCYTPDGEFLVGAIPGWKNVKLLTGCNGAGIAASAGLAVLAADMEENIADSSFIERFAPGRFGEIDADSPQWLARCIAARAGKTSG